MISYQEAIRILISAAPLQPQDELELAEIRRHVAARPVASGTAVPGFDNSAVDGFAVRSQDTAPARGDCPVALSLAGTLRAGTDPPRATPVGSAWQIMTGAPMPQDCDAVVPVERAVLQHGSANNSLILFAEPAHPNANIRRKGEDFQIGQPVLASGDVIGPEVVMALAAIGVQRVSVRQKPRVAIVCTGDELDDGAAAGSGRMVADANGPYLASAIPELGASIVGRGRAADDIRLLQETLRKAGESSDIVVTSGGVSAGTADLLPAALAGLGAEILFHKVAIRPGKPVLFARLHNSALVLALPGNPVAVAAGTRFFLAPLLRKMLGQAPEIWPRARSIAAIRRRGELTFFAKARCALTSASILEVGLLPGQESFKIHPLLAANCWAIVPPGDSLIGPGEPLELAPLQPGGFLGGS
jgi:molybdopterin molybdotransferase